MKDKFPLKIVLTDQQKNRFKATTSIDVLNKMSKNIRRELGYLEADYSILTRTARDTIVVSSQRRKADPRLYWLIGDNILRFLERIDDVGFYLLNQNSTLARDLEVSESSIKKLVSFRRRFPKLSLVNPAIPWAKYRDNKVPVSIADK
jgi:hypothetical protein